jgi:uncharacterized LabA/DUF88 family protein
MELADYLHQIWRFSFADRSLQGRGVRVTVVSTMESRPPVVASELRRQDDVFNDLLELKPEIIREERLSRAKGDPPVIRDFLPLTSN